MSASVSSASMMAQPPFSRRCLTWLARRRVVLSVLLFTSVVLMDIFIFRVRPRNLAPWSDPWTLCGELSLLAGLMIRAWAAGTIVKSRSLTRVGPYALVRNPLYVGSFLMMLGFGLLVHDWESIWIIVGPVALLYWLVVRNEEINLAKWFAHDWQKYAAATPRFVPRRWSPAALQGWSLHQWLKNHEYRAPAWSALALAGLAVWRAWAG